MTHLGSNSRAAAKVFSSLKRQVACQSKDAIVASLINSLVIPRPALFKALLMPGLRGPEVKLLRDRGVPAENIYAVEIDSRVHAAQLACARKFNRRYPHLHGISVLEQPMDVKDAMAYLWGRGHRFSFVYLDFFGQMNPTRFWTLVALFNLKLVNHPGYVIVNAASTARGSAFTNLVNRMVRDGGKVEEQYIKTAALRAGLAPSDSVSYSYVSGISRRKNRYNTTEVFFA